MSERVWDCEKFLKGEISDYPFSYDKAVIYRGCSEQIFFNKEYTADRRHEQISVLKKGYITAENGYRDQYTKDEVNSGDHAIAEPGVFCGYYETAESYARDVILKIEVPVEHLEVVAMPEEEIRNPSGKPKTYAVKSNKGLEKIYGSPDDLRFISRKSMEVNDGGSRIDYVMFKVDREVPLGTRRKPEDLQQNWIKGVYDTNFSKSPIFEPLDRYIRHMKAENPEKMPEGIVPNDLRKKIEKELRDLDKTREKLDNLRKIGLKASRKLKHSRDVNSEASRKMLVEDAYPVAEKYRERLEEFREFMQERYGVKIDFSSPGREVYRPEKVEEFFRDLEEELNEMERTESGHKSKLDDRDYSIDDYRQESEIEERMNREVVDKASRIPRISEAFERDSARKLLEA
ncbi:hypothetical protein ACK3SF_00025 [Candidatus Nanosalina sp. VS9-1]|uniref:hypothetical protein n=1 Tax=Candidatus Nanosalina sp. VS9-1 TaxID=3388566 RepID=UPI0039E0126B